VSDERHSRWQEWLAVAVLAATAILLTRWQGWWEVLLSPPPAAMPLETWAQRAALGALAVDLAVMAALPRLRRGGLAVAGVLIAFVVYVAHRGLFKVDPSEDAWLLRGKDGRWHYIACLFFRREAWHLPPGHIAGMLDPIGTSIANADAPVLACFLTKLFDPWLPEHFQVFGLWFLASTLLQGLFAALLLADVRAPWPFRLLGVALLVWILAFPSHDHAARAPAGALILASLWLYFRPSAGSSRWRDLLPWLALAFAGAATNAYLCLMVLALCAAALLRRWWPERAATWWQTALAMAAVLAVVLATWWAAGNFDVTGLGTLVAGELGIWSMDLLSPINPTGNEGLLPTWPMGAGQYEGIHYLGAPVLALLVWAVLALAWRRPPRATVLALLPLGAACLFLTLAALSPKITVAGQLVVELPAALYRPLAPFRASGRLFLPVVLVIVYLLLRLLAARLSAGLATAVLALLLVVQIGEGAGRSSRLRLATGADRRHQVWRARPDLDAWRPLAAGCRRLRLHPNGRWGGDDSVPLVYLAARLGLATSAGEVARGDHGALRRALESEAGFAADTLYVVREADRAGLEAQGLTCRELDGVHVCALPCQPG